MSLNCKGLARLLDFNSNDGMALYKFDCFKIDSSDNKNYELDGVLIIGYDVNVQRFISNTGVVRENIRCVSTIKVEKYSTNCRKSDAHIEIYRFSTRFNNYVEKYSRIPEEIHYSI